MILFIEVCDDCRIIEGDVGQCRRFDGTGNDVPGTYAETAVGNVENEMSVRVFPDQIGKLDIPCNVRCQCFYGNGTAEHSLAGHGVIEQAGCAVNGCKYQSTEEDRTENEDNQRPLQCLFMLAAPFLHCIESVQSGCLLRTDAGGNCMMEFMVLTSL